MNPRYKKIHKVGSNSGAGLCGQETKRTTKKDKEISCCTCKILVKNKDRVRQIVDIKGKKSPWGFPGLRHKAGRVEFIDPGAIAKQVLAKLFQSFRLPVSAGPGQVEKQHQRQRRD